MPSINNATQTRQIGNFNNTLNQHRDQGNGREVQGLLGVSNAANRRPVDNAEGMVSLHMGASVAHSIMQVHNENQATSSYGILKAAKQHPVATGIFLTAAVITVAGLAVSSTSDSSPSLPSLSDAMPQPEPLVMPAHETVLGVCERVIESFSLMNRLPADRISMNALNSIKVDTAKMANLARGMVQDDEMGSSELGRAAQCSGVQLRRNKVEVMISNLETMKSDLEVGGGVSVDAPIDAIRVRHLVNHIDRRLSVLRDISRNLYDATVIINSKILENAG